MKEIKGPPPGCEEIDGEMTNFDASISSGLADSLRAGNYFVHHAAWEFNGLVWYESGVFHEQVWRFHVPIGHVTALTLEDLMEYVNDTYGWD